MPLRRPRIFKTTFSTSAKPAASNWRTQYEQAQLVSQVSSILLQRRNWAPLLRNLNISPKLTPSLFRQVLRKTQADPQISLTFFNWAKTNLGFQPDLKTLCKLTRVLIESGLVRLARPILDSLVQTYPPTQIVDSLIQSCKGTDFQSPILSSVVECYCNKGFFLQALEVFGKTRDNGCVLSIRCCNSLLNVLQHENETRLAWCLFGSMLRNGVLANQFTWSIIARILCNDGKSEWIVRILDMGIYNPVIYNLIIDYCGKRGDFRAAFDYLNDMCNRKLNAGFSTYSSILDGASRYENVEVIEMAIGCMVDKGLLPKPLSPEYDLIIQKLADLGKNYAVDMFFKKARDERVELQGASYGYMLRAFSKEGRVKEAIRIYQVMLQNGIVVNDSCYNAFVSVLCKEDPSQEVSELLKDIIRRGFSPCASELSKYITSQCDKEHYCSGRRIDSAIVLHNKMEKLGGTLDVTTYNILLNALFKEKRVEEAVRVFDYMRRQNLVSTESFSVMISSLCREKELRKAMKIHDEMLKMGLKPDEKTYKRLIRGFK
ncbi:hypothetical protein F0562_014305 [Nyssa sinensis]|uniref:Pentacotripeptide-repeat region of PRORP domain-containing protein n=1 Tax=Nyssa sinensis TaxID=561372 RepID=A0A5J4ZSH1_9ASTE|nr:hypothetical protein F0562_014305 [Nyssa sinensis]